MKTDNKTRGNHYNEYAASHPLENAGGNSGSAGNNAAATGYLATLKSGFENVDTDVRKFGRNAKWKTITENTNAGGFAYLAAQKDNLKKHWIAGDSKEFTDVTQAADAAAKAEDALCDVQNLGGQSASNDFASQKQTFGEKIGTLRTKCC